MLDSLIMPMAAHLLWTAMLYVLLSLFRMPSVWRVGRRADGTNPFADLEGRASANLSNQFEWPLFFYLLCVLLLSQPAPVHALYVGLAWVFVVGRVGHSLVQIATVSIRLRGIVFSVNFIAVLIMWGVFLRDSLA